MSQFWLKHIVEVISWCCLLNVTSVASGTYHSSSIMILHILVNVVFSDRYNIFVNLLFLALSEPHMRFNIFVSL